MRPCPAFWSGSLRRLFAAGVAGWALGTGATAQTPVIDGLRDAAYGATRTLQNNQTGLGNSQLGQPNQSDGSELNGLLALRTPSTLYLLLPGNLRNDLTRLSIFIDSHAGGQNHLLNGQPSTDAGALRRMAEATAGSGDGLRFDSGFAPDFWMSVANGPVSSSSPNTAYHFAPLGVPAWGAQGLLGRNSGVGALLGGTNPLGFLGAVDHRNTLGVEAGNGISTLASTGLGSGVELAIPLSALEYGGGSIRVTAFLTSADASVVSNQVVGGLGGRGDLGDPRQVNLALIPGDQWVEVAEAPQPLLFDAIARSFTVNAFTQTTPFPDAIARSFTVNAFTQTTPFPDAIARSFSVNAFNQTSPFPDAIARSFSVNAFNQTTPFPDAIARSFTVNAFNQTVPFPDAIARSFSVNAFNQTTPFPDAIARSFSVRVLEDDVPPNDAVSREVSVFAQNLDAAPNDAVSREVSVFAQNLDAAPNDAVSREVSVFAQNLDAAPNDAVSREVSVFAQNLDAAPNDAVSREVSVLNAFPNLAVTEGSVPTPVETDRTFEVSWRLTNAQPVPVSPPWTDRVWFSANDQLDTSDTLLGSYPSFDPVPAAGSMVRRQFVQIARDLAPANGTYYLIVVADALGQIPEASETDNVRVIPMTVVRPPLPNLQVENLEAGASAPWGSRIALRFTVRNRGAAGTDAAQWQDYAILARGSTPTGDDPVRVPLDNVSFLNTNEGYVTEGQITIPRGLAGDFRLIGFADGPTAGAVNALREDNEDDNWASRPFVVTAAPYPNLRAADVRVPTNAFGSRLGRIAWRVDNVGTGPVPPSERRWNDAVYLSRDRVLDGADLLIGRRERLGELASGASYQAEDLNLLLPPNLSGDYFVIVQADDPSAVWEHTFETDNWAASERAVTIAPAPADLVAMPPTAPASVPSGTDVSIGYRIVNEGAFPTPGGFFDSLAISPTSEYNPVTALRLADRRRDVSLDATEGYDRSLALRLPLLPSGRYWLFSIADSGNEVFELDETNNVSPGRAIDLLDNAPNLVVPTVTGTPASVSPGDTITTTWTVRNTGAGATAVSIWRDTVFLAPRADSLVGAVALGFENRVQALGPNGQYTVTRTFAIPNLTAGSYRLVVQTDSGLVVDELSRENDNLGEFAPVTVVANHANLRPTITDLTGTRLAGSAVRLSYTTTNDGFGPARGIWTDAVYLSEDATLNRFDRRLAVNAVPGPLAVGGSYTREVEVTLPADAVGTMHLLVSSDDLGSVFEGPSEGDNVASIRLTIGVPEVNLQVTSVTGPPEVTGGDQVDLSWTVTNTGAQATAGLGWIDAAYLSKDTVWDPGDTFLGERLRVGSLASGTNYTSVLRATVPVVNAGSYFFLVRTDVQRALAETNEDDNTGSSGTLVSPPPPVDLLVESVDGPDAAVAGETARLRWTVRNRGTRGISRDWNDAVYLSKDPFWSIDDELVTRVRRSGGLTAGASYTVDETFTLPGVDPGAYHVVVRTDVRNEVREEDETNNGLASVAGPVDVTDIALGAWHGTSLVEGQLRYFRTTAPAGETLRWRYESEGRGDWNDLFIRRAQIARPSAFDLVGLPFFPDATLKLPTTPSGPTYATIRGTSVVGGGPTPGRLRAEIIPFSVEDVTPKSMGDTGQVTLTLQGGRLVPGTRVEMRYRGVIYPAALHIPIDDGTLKARWFNQGLLRGDYDLFVRSPQGEVKRWRGKIAVEAPTPLSVEVASTGVTPVRTGVPDVLLARLTNTGNIDVPYTTLAVGAGQPAILSLTPSARILPTVDSMSGLDPFRDHPLDQPFGPNRTLSFTVRDLEPGETVPYNVTLREFVPGEYPVLTWALPETTSQAAARAAWTLEQLRRHYVAQSGAPAELAPYVSNARAFLDRSAQLLAATGWFDANAFISVPVGGTLGRPISLPSPRIAEYLALAGARAALGLNPTVGLLGARVMGTAAECGAMSLADDGSAVLGTMVSAEELRNRLGPIVPAIATDVLNRIAVAPFDPNDKTGPPTKGPGRQQVGTSRAWTYTITFLNVSTTSAATRVVVQDQLSSQFDWRTARLREIEFNGTVVPVPPNRASITGSIPLSTLDGPSLLVDVAAGINPKTGVVTLVIDGIDPSTGNPPTNGNVGVLPPGRTGKVTISVQPSAGTGTGTLIGNEADITFEGQPVIRTNRTVHEADAGLPSSKVNPLPWIGGPAIPLTWSGTDPSDGSGLESFDVYVRIDDGPWQPWLLGTTQGQATYPGQFGRRYAFATRAYDYAGNAESLPTEPDTVILVGSPRRIRGQVTYQDLIDGVDGPRQVIVELRRPNEIRPYLSTPVTLDPAGRFEILGDNTLMDVSVKAAHWLRRSVRADARNGDVSGLVLSLANGDVDGDNTVTVFDYDRLSTAFDSVPGDPNWNPNADLDGDGTVTVFDYDILSRNFDRAGD